jgi:hypothetical protein
MSSLFSDPPFFRGQTLLNGEAIEYSAGTSYSSFRPVAGTEIVGQVKAFPDIHPVTRARLSNSLVYCIAARFKPASADTILNPSNDGSARGRAVVLRMDDAATAVNLLSPAEFTDTYASAGSVVAGQRVGYIDEYNSSEIRANDIVWVTIRGPAIIRKTTGAAINSGSLVSLQGTNVTTGLSVTQANIVMTTTLNSERVAMGIAIGSVNETTNAVLLGGDAASADNFVRVALYGVNWTY